MTTNEALRNALDAYVRADIYDTDYEPGCGIDHAVRLQAIAALDRAYAESEVPSPEPVDLSPGSVHVIDFPECGQSYHALLTSYQNLHTRIQELEDARWSLLETEKKRWAEIHQLRAERDALNADCDALETKCSDLADERDTLYARLREPDNTAVIDPPPSDNSYIDLNIALSVQNRKLRKARHTLLAEIANLRNQKQVIAKARDNLFAEFEELSAERDGLRNLYETVVEHRDNLFDTLSDQTDKNAQLRNERDELRAERVGLWNEREELRAKYEDLKARCTQPFLTAIADERNELQRKLNAIKDTLK